MKFVDFNYGKIAYKVKGKGRAIVLLHGFLESSEIWSTYAEKLSKGFKVVTIITRSLEKLCGIIVVWLELLKDLPKQKV